FKPVLSPNKPLDNLCEEDLTRESGEPRGNSSYATSVSDRCEWGAVDALPARTGESAAEGRQSGGVAALPVHDPAEGARGRADAADGTEARPWQQDDRVGAGSGVSARAGAGLGGGTGTSRSAEPR